MSDETPEKFVGSRITLGPVAAELVSHIDPKMKGGLPARMDAAILKLQGQAEAASDISSTVSAEAISNAMTAALSPIINGQTVELIELAKVSSGHHEQMLKDHFAAIAVENKQLQLALNVIRDMLSLALGESEHEEVIEFIRQVNAEVDLVIKPLHGYNYDPEAERNKRRNRLSEQLTLFAQRSQEGGQGMEQETLDPAKEELERER